MSKLSRLIQFGPTFRWGMLMSRLFGIAIAYCLVALAACGPSSGGETSDAGAVRPSSGDEDGDTIADLDEGRDAMVDTDADGVPDYLDDDSDGDGIGDAIEAGDELLDTAPFDSDGDGVPNFRDTDSDDNGRSDAIDGLADTDGNGRADFIDQDDDGDGLDDVTELGDPAAPLDSDGDGEPDFRDRDSDGDSILDAHERLADPDADGLPAYRDEDSDGDCLPDSVEAGDDQLETSPIDSDDDNRPDFLDRDSDDDGLADGTEDASCDGQLDDGETDPRSADSDGDGVTDLIEDAAGTDPRDPNDNPRARGDFVFVVPYQAAPVPRQDDLAFSTALQMVDVYLLLDRSESMTDELASIRNNIGSVLTSLTCPPLGNGDPSDCIPDLWSGVGSIIYANHLPYSHHLDLQPNPSLTQMSTPARATTARCPCTETTLAAAWSTFTGGGKMALVQPPNSCQGLEHYDDRTSCQGSPAGAGGLGYPCFRPDALPVVLIATDEAPIQGAGTYHCPQSSRVTSAANQLGAKMVGIVGSAVDDAETRADLSLLATETGAIDRTRGNAPLVFDGAGSNAAGAIEDGLRTLSNIPLDVSATAVDDASDAVDAVTAFIDHLETLQLGTAACADGLAQTDANGDGFADVYLDVLPRTPVCWRLVAKANTSVPATDAPQLFRARVRVEGDGATLLDTREVFFLVPPAPLDPPIE